MNEQNFTRKLDQFVTELNNHAYKDELLRIMTEQVADDTFIVSGTWFIRKFYLYCQCSLHYLNWNMQLVSIGSFYLGIESDKYCDFSIHLGNLLLEYQCPASKSNGTIQEDDGSGDGEASKSNGAI